MKKTDKPAKKTETVTTVDLRAVTGGGDAKRKLSLEISDVAEILTRTSAPHC